MPLSTKILNAIESPVERTLLEEDAAQIYRLGLDGWRATDNAQAKLGAAAGTPSGAFGITVGAHGTNAPQIVGEAASNNVKTNKMRRQFTLPPEYVAGTDPVLRIKAKETVAAAAVDTTVDAEIYKVAAEAGLEGSPTDLVGTTEIDVTTTVGSKDFAIDGADLEPGDELDIEITGATDDTGGANGTVLAIYDTALLLTIRG